MAVPDFQTLMRPVLRQLATGGEQAPTDVRKHVASAFGLSDAQLAELLPSGRQTAFANRVAWALGYLKQAGLAESPKRGTYRVTDRGRQALEGGTDRIDIAYLMRYPEFVAFRSPGSSSVDVQSESSSATADEVTLTPDEQMRVGYKRLRTNLAVLVAMGYGGSREDAAAVVGRSGDEGIDGIIKEDRLGLDAIYVQAKRWQNSVGRPDIQRFAGASGAARQEGRIHHHFCVHGRCPRVRETMFSPRSCLSMARKWPSLCLITVWA